MSGEAKLFLNVEKKIRGHKYEAGTEMAKITCADAFTPEDVDIALQLNQAKIAPVVLKDQKKTSGK